MPKKRRPRRRLRPAPFLWLILLVNLAVGLVFSRITSIVRVRVEGVPLYDRLRVESILVRLKDVPCLRVNGRRVETEIMEEPSVDSAEFTRNIFGNGLLVVRYRTPVAKLSEGDNEALSADGVLYRAVEMPPDLPALELPKYTPPAFVGFSGDWQPQGLAEMAIYARSHYPRIEVKIVVDRRGAVCLNIGSGQVILGSCDDLDLKLKTLESLLQRNPQELDQVQALNLTSPSAPAVVAKKARMRQ